MTTLLHSDGEVYHMEPDLYIRDNILFSDMCALKTTDGTTTTTISGHPKICGFQNAKGVLARFRSIYGFRQISDTEVVIADHGNHCLRLLNRITLQTSRYAGLCERRNITPGFADGTSTAKFDFPRTIIDDFKHPGMLIVTDYNNSAIRNVNKLSVSSPRPVSTFVRSTEDLAGICGIAQDAITGDMYVVVQYTIKKVTYSNQSISILAGSANHGSLDCDFSNSLFQNPHEIILIGGNSLLVTDPDNNKLRPTSLDTRTVTSLCSGVSDSSDGNMKTCALYQPWSLMVLNRTLYVGENKRIRKIQGKIQYSNNNPQYVLSSICFVSNWQNS